MYIYDWSHDTPNLDESGLLTIKCFKSVTSIILNKGANVIESRDKLSVKIVCKIQGLSLHSHHPATGTEKLL